MPRVDSTRIEQIRREHATWSGRPRAEISEPEAEVQDLLDALDEARPTSEKLRSYKAARQMALLADKLHGGHDRRDEAALRHWESKIAALVCEDSEETFEDLLEDMREERDALAKKLVTAEKRVTRLKIVLNRLYGRPASDDVLTAAALSVAGVVVRPAPDIPGTWVAHFMDFNCVTQGSSRLDAIVSLLDAARLMLQHLQPSGVCNMTEFLAREIQEKP